VPSQSKRVPLQDGLYTWPDERPRLIAGKCRQCGELAFPRQQTCASCTSSATDEVLLGRRGTLWTWTIQHFPPPSPPYTGDRASFAPFGVGYVELPEGIRVEARLTENDPTRLRIGMEMELVIEPFGVDDDGNERVTFAFAPAGR